MSQRVEPFTSPDVRGFLHQPAGAISDGIVLAHGAGSNANGKLLVSLAVSLSEAGYLVLRIDLPFRQQRPSGPPFPAMGEKDRAGILAAGQCLRDSGARRVILGGHSYGGRQATMLAAENLGAADSLLLLSYPLHPPRKPAELRTSHFPALRTPSVFVHGTRDPFGSMDEMRGALELIPAPVKLLEVTGAGHDLAAVARGASAAILEAVSAMLTLEDLPNRGILGRGRQ